MTSRDRPYPNKKKEIFVSTKIIRKRRFAK